MIIMKPSPHNGSVLAYNTAGKLSNDKQQIRHTALLCVHTVSVLVVSNLNVD